MPKRTADDDGETPSTPVGPVGPSVLPPPTAAPPTDLVFCSVDHIVSPTEFNITHVGADGTAVFQSDREIVVANIPAGIILCRLNPATTVVHGVIDRPEAAALVCISNETWIHFVEATADGPVFYSEEMPPDVCGGLVAVRGDLVLVTRDSSAVAILPLLCKSGAMFGMPPLANIMTTRSGSAVVVTDGPETWSIVDTGAPALKFEAVDTSLEHPMATLWADDTNGVNVMAVFPDTGRVNISGAYPAFSDIVLPIEPVAVQWEGSSCFVLGKNGADTDNGPVVYVVSPSLGLVTSIFFPDRLCVRPGPEPDAELNTIRGRYVLWNGQAYMVGAPC